MNEWMVTDGWLGGQWQMPGYEIEQRASFGYILIHTARSAATTIATCQLERLRGVLHINRSRILYTSL